MTEGNAETAPGALARGPSWGVRRL